MRKLLTVALALVPLAPAAAQAHVQLIAGLSSSTVSALSNGTSVSDQSRSSFSAGAGVIVPIGGKLEFAPEVLYTQKGFVFDDGTITSTVKPSYLEVPVLVRAPLLDGPVRPFVTAGPEIAFELSCKAAAKLDNGSASETSGCSADGATDYGVVVGGGVQIRRFAVAARYDIGLHNAGNVAAPSDISIRNRAWFFLASYVIR